MIIKTHSSSACILGFRLVSLLNRLDACLRWCYEVIEIGQRLSHSIKYRFTQ